MIQKRSKSGLVFDNLKVYWWFLHFSVTISVVLTQSRLSSFFRAESMCSLALLSMCSLALSCKNYYKSKDAYEDAVFFFFCQKSWPTSKRDQKTWSFLYPKSFVCTVSWHWPRPARSAFFHKDNVRFGGVFWRNDGADALKQQPRLFRQNRSASEYIIWHNAPLAICYPPDIILGLSQVWYFQISDPGLLQIGYRPAV